MNRMRIPWISFFLLVTGLFAVAQTDDPSPISAEVRPVLPKAERPKVGVVLGGGGALGLAHVGVLRELERLEVPIDYIGGTSMGSIIAGLYAAGMNPDEIEGFLLRLDWWEILSDETPRRDLAFRRKFHDQRYLFNAEFGLKGLGLEFRQGIASGQKFNNIMQWVTLPVVHIEDFDQLPIPFRAVATDLETGKAVVMKDGNLAVAMRASMAVPAFFTPVEREVKLLVDGRVVNNIPVDVVKDMGADIIIAVDVGAAGAVVDTNKFKSMFGIMGRTYTIMQRPKQDEMLKLADLVIAPDVKGMTASQFHRIAEFFPIGEAAAKAMEGDILKTVPFRVAPEDKPDVSKRVNIADISIHKITVEENDRVSTARILGLVRSKPGEPLNPDDLSDDLRRIHGIGEFSQVQFRVAENDRGENELQFHTYEKPWGPHYVRFGLRLDSGFNNDARWKGLINLQSMSLNALGAEWTTDLRFGNEIGIATEWYQPLRSSKFVYVAPSFLYNIENVPLYVDDEKEAEYEVTQYFGRFEIGSEFTRYGQMSASYVLGNVDAAVETGDSDLPETNDDVAGFLFDFELDRLDRSIFPLAGYRIFSDLWVVRESYGSDVEFDRWAILGVVYKTVGKHTFGLGGQYGSSLDSDLPPYFDFTIGGPMRFSGLADDQLRGRYVATANLTYRYEIKRMSPTAGRAMYAMLRLDAGNVWEEDNDVDLSDLIYGGSIGVGIDSKMGPIVLGVGIEDEYSSPRLFFSLGADF